MTPVTPAGTTAAVTPTPAAGPTTEPALAPAPAPASTEREEAERTGARTPEAAELVSGAREHIDVLDARIMALIGERTAVSEQIQRARLGSGGRRVNLAREMEILERYREELGAPGTRLAMLLLELCRGRV
ncbi:chorismate mutase [Streptomyces otsuchiensis]|uniref:chorismate mutase n=1 Tax=Streptomyces otsuchiensis TaxID=2681388 RepID=UPI001030A4F1|nr:chorismate mutase [Streptomyces otsuchiensis]